MLRFNSPFGVVTLTDERKEHIFTFHPDIRGCMKYFAQAFAEPDKMVRSVHDATVIICYKRLPRRDRWLAIVVKTGSRPFILTAYLAKKPKRE